MKIILHKWFCIRHFYHAFLILNNAKIRNLNVHVLFAPLKIYSKNIFSKNILTEMKKIYYITKKKDRF